MNTFLTRDNNNTIIVAVDFSEASLNAAAYAADLALAAHQQLLLLHIVILEPSYGEVMLNVNTNELIKDATDELEQLKTRLLHKAGIGLCINTEVKLGSFFTELKACCETIKPYAVIMGSQGTTAVERMVFGGHTVYAMQHLMWPLITVPPVVKGAVIKKIGLACDFDNMIYKTPVDDLKKLVRDFHASLHVINVGSKDEFNPDVVFEYGLLKERLENLNPEFHFLTHKDASRSLMDFAVEHKLDLLIVLPKRYNLLETLTHKSHTKQLVLKAQVPVMALHQ